MLDFSVWELVVIGGVALVVIGPERLPRVARTAGLLLGRFQRYVAEVKSDINREIEASELKELKTSVEDAARSIEHNVRTQVDEAQQQFKEVQADLKETGAELEKTEQELRDTSAGFSLPHMGTAMPKPAAVGAQELTASAAAAQFGISAPSTPDEATTDDPQHSEAPHDSEAPHEGETPHNSGVDEIPSPQLELGLDPNAARSPSQQH
ncbi:MAG: twin-arginine translocase TatA/TatE family subunit [Betaproteobacteria bacterium]